MRSGHIRHADDFATLIFAPDFLSAETSLGQTVSFTRSEAKALAALAANPHRLLTREQLLQAVGGDAADKSERNIDFVINRLRRKLTDNARNPRYIATRYGEGYVWIGPSSAVGRRQVKADLVVGPLSGLGYLGGHRDHAERFASELSRSLRAAIGPHETVALDKDFTPPAAGEPPVPPRSVELTFVADGPRIDCIATARDTRSGRILAIRRVPLGDGAMPTLDLKSTVDALASFLVNESWRAMVTLPEADVPLPVSMYDASVLEPHDVGTPSDSDRKLLDLLEREERRNIDRWKKVQRRLGDLRAERPDDAELKLMEATHLHSKYVTFGMQLFMSRIDERAGDEEQIEQLVLEALPYIQSRADHVIMAAKLLHFVDRGYREMAVDLAEAAYRESVSVASSLAVVGQLRAFAGEIDAALRCFDQALHLSTNGSRARLYTQVLKCQALMAAGDYDQLADAKREFYGAAPLASVLFEPMFADPDKPSIRARLASMAFSRQRAAALLQFCTYISARLFHDQSHRDNAIRTPLSLMVRRHGREVVPAEVTAAFPLLLDQLS